MKLPDGPVKDFVQGFRTCSLDLDHEINRRFASLMGEQRLTREELASALRHLYWEYPGGVDEANWIWIAFGFVNDKIFSRDEYFSIIQNFRYPFPCDGCGTAIPVLVRDREDADRFWQGITLLCPDCTKERGKRRAEEYVRLELEERRVEREAKIAELRAMPYADYLQTEHWQTVREATLKRDDRACRLCGSAERLQVHHRTYERRGCEPPGDTTTLCEDCHQMFHDHGKLARPD